jgi:lipopolysaccharide/colanic/teichoic acid biosynthesis glycosyltransferase
MGTRRPVYPAVKRIVDVLLAGAGLVIASPVMAVVALAVRLDVGSPVLFRQVRPGLEGRCFELVKFRTMRTPGSGDGVSTDEQRLTRFGRWLRSTSLDELPTLVNVLRGDMSLVGPRPLLVEYLERYTPEQARRHEVRPGITGLAQVRGRNALTWEQKFAADIEYVDGMGPRLDARIMLTTLATVLRREGISAPGVATMHLFTGVQAAQVGDRDQVEPDDVVVVTEPASELSGEEGSGLGRHDAA